MSSEALIDRRWRRALRCAPDVPGARRDPLAVRFPLGLYAYAVGPQDDEPAEETDDA